MLAVLRPLLQLGVGKATAAVALEVEVSAVEKVGVCMATVLHHVLLDDLVTADY